MPAVPREIRRERLLLRAWTRADAAALHPLLVANVERLTPWIPAHVATPVPLPELEQRLDGFAATFAAGTAFRYAVIGRDDERPMGGMSLFPRNAIARVAVPDADRAEIGYWLDAAHTGNGFVTEAASALLEVATSLPWVTCVEIRCDAANLPSAAVPRRLGFELAEATDGLQVWRRPALRRDEGVTLFGRTVAD